MSVAIAILGLALLVLIHEAGHFFTARAVGMRPRRFYLGFGPPIVKVTRGGIEYGIGTIPLGGYVKIPGMHRPAPSDLEGASAIAVREQPLLVGPVERSKRALAAGSMTPEGVHLEELRKAFAAAELSPLARKTAERGVNELADAVSSDAYWRQRAWRKVAVIFAGPATNLAFAVVLFAIFFMHGGGKATQVVDSVPAGHPAAAAGLRPGDRIVAIGHRPVTAADISKRIQGSQGRPLVLTVVRDGHRVELGPVSARKDQGVWRLGLVLQGESVGFAAASWDAVKLTGVVTREIGRSLANLAQPQGRKDISSPVGIVQQSSAAVRAGVESYLPVLGFISLSLALLNLLPLLPLDGGHIAFSIIEGIRGRAVSRSVYERVSAFGLVLVLLLFIVGLKNDVGRLGGG